MTDMFLIAGWCFAASLFLPLFVWALMPLLPRCAAIRHLVWVTMFAVLLALPALALLVPPQMVFTTAVTEVAPVATPVAASMPQGWGLADAVPLLILAWLAGIVFHLARLGLGLFGLYRLRRSSVPFDGAQDVRLADDGPLAFGTFRPLILLPHEADNWPLPRLVAVLAHERAHLTRHDSLTQMLAQIVCAFYWPNLLLWLAARRMRQEAEIAADNAVLSAGIRPSDYAAELLQLAGQKLRLPAAAMAAPSLEARVKSVLSPEPSRSGARAMDVFKIIWLGSAAAVALAFARPAIAQDATTPPAPAPQAAPAPAAPPAPPAAPAPRPVHHHHRITVRDHGTALATEHGDVVVTENGTALTTQDLTAADKARMDQAMAQVRSAMAGIRPEIDRALQKARAERAAAQSVQQAMPQVHAAIAQALAQIRPVIHQALVNERVDVKVSVVLNHAQAQIDQAVAHAEQEAERDAAHAQRDADREAARAARTYHRDENPDPGDTNPNP